MLLKPIGTFESAQVEPYQAGRQPDELGLFGKIKLNSGENFEQALQDLAGCSHLWIIFGFHQNENWKPLVQAPRSSKKIGVFATRAPYRPNPIGLSLVELISVNGLVIEIGGNDLLHQSPIYDIKPYHPEYDVAENAKIEWIEKAGFNQNKISISPFADSQLEFLEKNNLKEIRTFIARQLEYDPTNKDKKRVEQFSNYFSLAYRTWRIDFTLAEDAVGILSIRSGYSEQDLLDLDDKYADKALHRLFNREFK